jgi:tRNA1(Val) A37 N6-methylase TrmN6
MAMRHGGAERERGKEEARDKISCRSEHSEVSVFSDAILVVSLSKKKSVRNGCYDLGPGVVTAGALLDARLTTASVAALQCKTMGYMNRRLRPAIVTSAYSVKVSS